MCMCSSESVTQQFLICRSASLLWNRLFVVCGENLACCNRDFCVLLQDMLETLFGVFFMIDPFIK